MDDISSWRVIPSAITLHSRRARGVRMRARSEDAVDGAEKRVRLAATPVVEVIQVEGPDHGTTQTHRFDVLRLLPDHGDVIVADPLVPFVSIGSHGPLWMLHHCVALGQY